MAKKHSVVFKSQPVLQLTPSGDKFIFESQWKIEVNGRVIICPKGWISDATSVPWWGRILVPQIGTHAFAAFVHDRLLDEGVNPREADKVFRHALFGLGVPWLRSWLMWIAVRIYDLVLRRT